MTSVFQSQLEHKDIVEQILKDEGALMSESALETSGGASLELPGQPSLGEAVRSLRDGHSDLTRPSYTEAIVMKTGFPSLLVQNGTFEMPKLQHWKDLLGPNRQKIDDVISNVGRVDLVNHPGAKWVGTAWRINEDTFLTNRHVAEAFVSMRSGKWQVDKGIKAYVDLREEHQSSEELELFVSSIVHVEMSNFRDIAVMRVKSKALDDMGAPISLQLGNATPEAIAVIGYPAKATRNNPVDAMDRYFKDIYDVKRLAPGYIMNKAYNADVFTHNATTLGGNSGSVIIDVNSGKAVGLHFAGSALTQNYAVRMDAVMDVLTKQSVSFSASSGGGGGTNGGGGDILADGGGGGSAESAHDLADREGYQPDFLGDGSLHVPLPGLNCIQERKLARTENGETELRYQHFSVVMNGDRQLAFYAAANIDGDDLRRPRRVRSFKLDPRMDRSKQAGEDLYRHNPLDRGHLIRRLDPCWGTKAQADQANRDSMFFPNIGPQHKDLNQRIWLRLEEHILNGTDHADARVSVFVGCLFGDDDPAQEASGVKVPMGFWKVVASIGRERRGRSTRRVLQAQAFLLFQDHLVKPRDLELVFGRDFEEHQITIEELERVSGLDFGPLKDADTFALTGEMRSERVAQARESTGLSLASSDHIKPLTSIDDVETG